MSKSHFELLSYRQHISTPDSEGSDVVLDPLVSLRRRDVNLISVTEIVIVSIYLREIHKYWAHPVPFGMYFVNFVTAG